jgi:prolyl oligopeptidase
MQLLLSLGVMLSLGVTVVAQTAQPGQLPIQGREGIKLPAPPSAEAVPVTDNYFGTRIVDNYRWLEDAKSTQTRAFIDAQNAYASRYMKQARIRSQIADGLDALENIPEWGIPIERAGSYFFMKRMAGEEQYSIYVRHGWTGKDERLVDPAALSREANVSVSLLDVSRDGNEIAYEIRHGGADESEVHVVNLKTGKTLEDTLPSARYESASFAPNGASLYFSRRDKTGYLVYQHVFGARSSQDTLLFGREFHGEKLGPDDIIGASLSDDGRYLVVRIDRGVPAHRVDIVYRDLAKPNSFFEILVWGLESRFEAQWAGSGSKAAWYVKTDYQSPKGRILRADPGVMPEAWTTIIPEATDAIDSWSIVGDRIYVNRLHDVKTEAAAFTLDGKPTGIIDYETMGTASPVYGRTIDRYGYFSFQSFLVPPTIYRLDTVTGKRDLFAQPKIPIDPGQYELKQVFAESKDGTRIPIFIAGKKGLRQDGSERLLMSGYGGFNVSETPAWSPARAWWLEQGGWFALPNLRGGGEYGESWHEQGMFEKKQNVFDDWFAAAQYLIASKHTSPEHFAITGRSNGGLLMGASITQHPELFSAVVCGYPLLDMLRYQKFLVGSFWKTEYGSSEKELQFNYLLKYSPYHHVKAGAEYPAVLFFTGENDTRVDPLHARKMAALMQAVSANGRPILLHDSVDGGHSAGVGVAQQIEDDADQLAFLWTETGNATPAKSSVSAR